MPSLTLAQANQIIAAALARSLAQRAQDNPNFFVALAARRGSRFERRMTPGRWL